MGLQGVANCGALNLLNLRALLTTVTEESPIAAAAKKD
jgi:hypothetical protein